jgi:hypothetical protein
MRVWRVATRYSTAGAPVEHSASAEPKPVFPPWSLPLVTLGFLGFPLAPDQLPASTLGLRHLRVGRCLADAYGVAEDALGDEVRVSAAAAYCGAHDVLFEWWTNTAPVRESWDRERAFARRALQCARRSAPSLRQATSFEVDYAWHDVRSNFALLPLPSPEPLRDSLFPPLETKPGGALRALCRDASSNGASDCEHGMRSRVLLEVGGGFVGAYAREAPTLLDR